MKLNQFLFFFLALLFSPFAHADDFANVMLQADLALFMKDYERARKGYELALSIRKDDDCEKKLAMLKENEKRRKENRKEKARLQKVKSPVLNRKPYQGALKGLIDDEDDKFDYTGWILNGQPHGEGTATYTVYDKTKGWEKGKWLNGQKYGLFEAESPDGLKLTGAYINGKPEGIAKGSNEKAGIRFELFAKSGKPDGIQKVYSPEKQFVLSYKEGKMAGTQFLYYTTSEGQVRFEIQSEEGELKGKTIVVTKNGKMEGYTINMVFQGEVKVINRQLMNGYMIGRLNEDGNLQGPIRYHFTNGNKFEGVLEEGKVKGKGVFEVLKGPRIEADFDGSIFKITGPAVVTYPDKTVYKGGYDMENFVAKGHGVWEYQDGRKFEGNFRNGFYDGEGTLTIPTGTHIVNCPDCVTYTGEFYRGLKSGKGKCYDAKGTLLYAGEFINDKPKDIYPMKLKK
ncbi:hypothetical protein [Runella sp.]|uniref:hypothetical protein n=1 Tax=Runella sp. TaxID=1960881 RepID=UPI003D0AC533